MVTHTFNVNTTFDSVTIENYNIKGIVVTPLPGGTPSQPFICEPGSSPPCPSFIVEPASGHQYLGIMIVDNSDQPVPLDNKLSIEVYAVPGPDITHIVSRNNNQWCIIVASPDKQSIITNPTQTNVSVGDDGPGGTG